MTTQKTTFTLKLQYHNVPKFSATYTYDNNGQQVAEKYSTPIPKWAVIVARKDGRERYMKLVASEI